MSETPLNDDGSLIKGFHKFTPSESKLEETARILSAVRKSQPRVTLEQAKSQADMVALQVRISTLTAQLDKCRKALEIVLASAKPHPTENPTMHAAWQLASTTLSETADTLAHAGCRAFKPPSPKQRRPNDT